MKYLCLVYGEERTPTELSEGEPDAVAREIIAYREELRQSGHHIVSSPLQSVETATTIRVRNGKTSITDGPAAATREQLGGFYLIEATDLNDAIRVASRNPSARFGSIEVWPLRELNPE